MAANIQAVCSSWKVQILQGSQNLNSGGNTLKAALYYQNSGLGAATTAYSATGEVSGAGYVAGGATVTNAASPALSGSTAIWTPSASVSWSGLTIASNFDCLLLYNSSVSNEAIAVFTFPAQTISSGNLLLTMPANTLGTALIQVS